MLDRPFRKHDKKVWDGKYILKICNEYQLYVRKPECGEFY